MTNLSKHLYVKAEACDLPCGATTNDIKCPWCGESKSFSVTRTLRGDLLFVCHRASCDQGGKGGYVRGPRGGTGNPPEQGRVFTPRVFDHPTTRVGGVKLAHLVSVYGLTPKEIAWADWSYAYKMDRLVMPVLSPVGAHRGSIARVYDKSIVPKTLTYKEVDDVWMGWYLRPGIAFANAEGKFGEVVVVEDCISALKASRLVPACAILGTHISHDMVRELTSTAKRVVLCLDQDATQKAYDYCKEFSAFGNFITVPLSKDIKDMNEEELEEWSDRL